MAGDGGVGRWRRTLVQLLFVSGDVFLERNEELGRPTFVSPLFY